MCSKRVCRGGRVPHYIPGMSGKLRYEREKLGVSQEQIADIIGVERRTYGGYENDVSNPDAWVLYKLCGLYHVSADYLLGLE